MQGVILVVLDRPDVTSRVLEAARRLAELTDAARINAIAIRMPPIATIMPTEEILTPEQESRIRAAERHRAEALRAVFDSWVGTMAGNDLATEWFDTEAAAAEVVEEWGRRADFVVLKRPRHRATETEWTATHAALFEADRPVLFVPPDQPPTAFGRDVAIAWRNDSRTIKAVLAALRWLGRAETIHVLAGAREGMPQPAPPDILEEHAMKAALHIIPIATQDVFGEALLAKAHELACDMIVMGAFARHPARSLVLGGVTRHMLAHADLPVFMRH